MKDIKIDIDKHPSDEKNYHECKAKNYVSL